MIKSKFVFAVSFVALFACGVARADIASVKYVDESKQDKLTPGTNVTISEPSETDGKITISVPTLDEGWYYYESEDSGYGESYKTMPVSGDAFMRALNLVLPGNYITSDDWVFWKEEDGDWYNDGMSLSHIVKDLAYTRVRPLTNQVSELSEQLGNQNSDLSRRISSKQNKISTSYGDDCYEEEGKRVCDTNVQINNGLVSINGDGEIVGAKLLDEGDGEFITDVTVAGDGTVTISRGDAPVPEGINAAGGDANPVYIDKDGKAQAVTSIANSLLPLAMPTESVEDETGATTVPFAAGAVYAIDTESNWNAFYVDALDEQIAAAVPTVGFMDQKLAGKQAKLANAGSADTPVFIKDGKAQVVTSIANSLLPLASANSDSETYLKGAVYIANTSSDYSFLMEDKGLDHEVVPTFGYVQGALGKKFELPDSFGLEDMGAEQGDVLGFIVQDNGNAENEAVLAKIPYATDEQAGLVTVDTALNKDSTNPVQNKVVTAALDGKQKAFTDEELSEYIDQDSYERGGVPVGYVYDGGSGFEYRPLSLIKASLLPFPGEDNEGVYHQGAVYVANSSEEYSNLTDEMEGGVAFDNKDDVVPSVEYMNEQIELKSAKDATATVKGIATLGTIPAGADKKGTATIWIE